MDERISVIVPIFNCAAQVGRCLDSLLGQDIPLEVVAVDDGSSDESFRVLEGYADRIRVIRQENAGVTAARLAGVRAASGDWIGFVDGDDAVEPWMFRHLLDMAKTAGAEIAHCGHQVHYPDGRVDYLYNSGVRWERDRAGGLRDLLDGGQINSSLCTKLFRRELFDGIETWMDGSLKNGEDLLMNYYLFSRGSRSVYEDVCPYRYYLREGSASHRRFDEHALFDPVKARERILEGCGEDLKSDAETSLLRNLLFAYALASQRPKRESGVYRQKARGMLQARKDRFFRLRPRNRVLAELICRAPWAFDISYGIYTRVFRRKEEH